MSEEKSDAKTKSETSEDKQEKSTDIIGPFELISDIRFGLVSKALRLERELLEGVVSGKERPGGMFLINTVVKQPLNLLQRALSFTYDVVSDPKKVRDEIIENGKKFKEDLVNRWC